MTNQSKYYYDQHGRDPKEGGWGEGDFHCWLVNKTTGKIIECIDRLSSLWQVKEICDIHKCDPNRPVYSEWGKRDIYFKRHIADTYRLSADFLEYEMNRAGRVAGQWGCCNWNSVIYWKRMDPEEAKNWRIAIGSMGWKTRDGLSQWYEYG